MDAPFAIAALSALAHETRLGVFRYLVQAEANGVPVGRISEHARVHSSTMSFHLHLLRQAGLVTSRREGRLILYAVNHVTMNELLMHLRKKCCQPCPQHPRLGVKIPSPAARQRFDNRIIMKSCDAIETLAPKAR
jgi:ArsR family transcriptional regulator